MKNEEYSKQMIAKTKLLAVTLKLLRYKQQAEIRGPQNPLFNNATAIWDGVVIHEHENITRYTTWGASSDVSGASGMFMGAQALCWGFGEQIGRASCRERVLRLV